MSNYPETCLGTNIVRRLVLYLSRNIQWLLEKSKCFWIFIHFWFLQECLDLSSRNRAGLRMSIRFPNDLCKFKCIVKYPDSRKCTHPCPPIETWIQNYSHQTRYIPVFLTDAHTYIPISSQDVEMLINRQRFVNQIRHLSAFPDF